MSHVCYFVPYRPVMTVSAGIRVWGGRWNGDGERVGFPWADTNKIAFAEWFPARQCD